VTIIWGEKKRGGEGDYIVLFVLGRGGGREKKRKKGLERMNSFCCVLREGGGSCERSPITHFPMPSETAGNQRKKEKQRNHTAHLSFVIVKV